MSRLFCQDPQERARVEEARRLAAATAEGDPAPAPPSAPPSPRKVVQQITTIHRKPDGTRW